MFKHPGRGCSSSAGHRRQKGPAAFTGFNHPGSGKIERLEVFIMKMKLPDRKEMNESRMMDLVSTLAEYKGGDDVVMGELFWLMFGDLSAANQEAYIARLKSDLKELQK